MENPNHFDKNLDFKNTKLLGVVTIGLNIYNQMFSRCVNSKKLIKVVLNWLNKLLYQSLKLLTMI